MPRSVLLALLWTAPAAFVFSFLKGYVLERVRPPIYPWIAIALSSGVPPLLVPSLGIRIAGGVAILLIAFCAIGMRDKALYYKYTGYGAAFFVPVALAVVLAQLVLALIVSLRSS